MNVYLDNAATTPLSTDMKKYLVSLLDIYGNPSSLYTLGQQTKKIINESRNSVAHFIHTKPTNICFTSGGSASNTLAVRGYYSKHNCCVLYSPIAHKSIIECVKSYKHSYPLKVNKSGLIDIADLYNWLDARQTNPFIVIDYANSEIGTIQNVKAIIDLVHFYNGIVYLDCTGSIPTIPLDVKHLDADMCGFSAHKLGGLKGCGVLYKKSNIELESLVYGSQEQGLIGGTENILGIASFGRAVRNYNYDFVPSILHIRDYVYQYIIDNISDCYLVGCGFDVRLANNLYLCFNGVEGESLMMMLDLNGVQVSTGSACNSGNLYGSYALSAIGIDKNDIHSCIRMSFSGKETMEELDYVCKTLSNCVELLRNMTPNKERDIDD